MNCAYHQDRVAVVQCSNCGCYVCPVCYTAISGKMYCNLCAGHMLNQGPVAKGGTTPAMASGNISGLVTAAVVPQEIKNASWFERHLNWTLALCGYVGGLFACLILGFFVGVYQLIADTTASDTFFDVSGFLVYSAVLISVTAWYLKRKKRRLLNLLHLIWGPGWIILLCLKNENAGIGRSH